MVNLSNVEEKALRWWKLLSSQDRARLLSKYYPNDEWFILSTGSSRITTIWMKENKSLDNQQVI